jgi:conjugal transfer/entry exclusion protein
VAWKESAIEILSLIDKLEEVISSATKIPVSKRRLLDLEKVAELVDQMRLVIPRDIKEAEEVLLKREDLLNQALVEARRIRTSAESEFRSRVEDSELVKESQEQVVKILEDAEEKSKNILKTAHAQGKVQRASSDQYSQDVLYKLEQRVSDILSTVRHGIDTLDKHEKPPVK